MNTRDIVYQAKSLLLNTPEFIVRLKQYLADNHTVSRYFYDADISKLASFITKMEKTKIIILGGIFDSYIKPTGLLQITFISSDRVSYHLTFYSNHKMKIENHG